MGATHYSWMCLISTFFFKKKNAGEKRLRINVIGQKAIVSPKQGRQMLALLFIQEKGKLAYCQINVAKEQIPI